VNYIIAEGAIEELNQFRKTLLGSVAAHLITKERAKELHLEKMRVLFGQAWRESEGVRTIAIQCGFCRRIDKIQSDVVYFTCHCNPTEQFVARCRSIDFGGAESLIRSAKPGAQFA
jgi:hypothetical protein